MVNTTAEAIHKACAQIENDLGTCQFNVRTWLDAPAAGDRDHDGDADAVDGWLSEPKEARVALKDLDKYRGIPLSYSGGSHGFGHRALLLNVGRIRSTDTFNNRYSPRVTSTIEASTTAEAVAILGSTMGGLHFLGGSRTIDGLWIPDLIDHTKPAPKPQTRGWRVDEEIHKLRISYRLARKADPHSLRTKMLAAALKSLMAVPTFDKKEVKS